MWCRSYLVHFFMFLFALSNHHPLLGVIVQASMESVKDRNQSSSLPTPSSNSHETERTSDGTSIKRERTMIDSIKQRATQTVSHEDSTIPLAWQAMLTGLVDALICSRSQIWTGFQTGNMVQFSQNIAQYILPNAERFPLLTLERSISVCSFIVGSFVGGHLGNRFGHSKRGWVAFSAFIQSLLLFGAAGILLSLPRDAQPTFQHWPAIIALTSLSMGMQSVCAQKLSSPAFATTVAFTATLTQIASDPFLFHLSLSPVEQVKHSWKERRKNRKSLEGTTEQQISQDQQESEKKPFKPKTLGRDRRMFGILMLCIGAGVAECLIYSRADLRGGMAVAASFKMVQALLWFFATHGKQS